MALRGVQYPRPGSYGLRTQANLVEGDEDLKFASVALNGAIDDGKLVSREAFIKSNSTPGGILAYETLFRYSQPGLDTAVTAAAGKVYLGAFIGALIQRYDYSATSTTLNSWSFAQLAGKVFGFQAGIAPFHMTVDDGLFTTSTTFTGVPWTGTPDVVLAASGRLWVGNDAAGAETHTLWWSNLLDGTVWNAGDAGELDLREVWPGGHDSIVALAISQDRIIIFGKNNILLYTLPADRNPANMTLTDAVSNLGCVARDSVIMAGGDLYFLAQGGYYKLPRLAQVTSLMSLVCVSQNVADEFADSLVGETLSKVRAGYDQTEDRVLLTFPTGGTIWAWQLDQMVPTAVDGVRLPAVTRWEDEETIYAFAFSPLAANPLGAAPGGLFAGSSNGVRQYRGYNAFSEPFEFEYASLWNAMQDETRLKALKSWALTLETQSGRAGTFYWKQDYKEGTERTQDFTCNATDFAEDPGIGVVNGQLGGSCSTVKTGCRFTIGNAGEEEYVILHSKRIYATPGATKIR